MHISVQIYNFYRKLTEYKANFLYILTQVSQVESIFMWVCHNINLGADYTDFFALLNNSSRKNLCKHAQKTVLIRVIRA